MIYLFQERRGSRRRFRGRGRSKSQGAEGGYVRGNRYHTSHDEGNNQGRAPRTVRGRGPRRYEPITKNKGDFPAAQSKRSALEFTFIINQVHHFFDEPNT